MAGHFALELLVAALALSASPGSQRFEEPVILRSEAATADCRTGRLQRYPPYLARGLQLSLGFRGPVVPDADYRVLDQLLVDFKRSRFIVNDSSVIALSSRGRVAGRAAVDRLIQQACRIEQVSAFRLSEARTMDVRELQRAAAIGEARRAARERADREAERRRAAEARAAHRALLRSPPTPAELTPVLRDHWQEVIADEPQNAVTDGQFSRVRDVRCRRTEGYFRCRVGVLGTSARGPEYEQLELDFGRRVDGSVVFLSSLMSMPMTIG